MNASKNGKAEETVKVTISLQKSLLEELDKQCENARPRLARSRRIQELIVHDLDRAEMEEKAVLA